MQRITVENVRTALQDMKNTYVNALTNDELRKASLQDDLGLDERDFAAFVAKLENENGYFIDPIAVYNLGDELTVTVKRFMRVGNAYLSEARASA